MSIYVYAKKVFLAATVSAGSICSASFANANGLFSPFLEYQNLYIDIDPACHQFLEERRKLGRCIYEYSFEDYLQDEKCTKRDKILEDRYYRYCLHMEVIID